MEHWWNDNGRAITEVPGEKPLTVQIVCHESHMDLNPGLRNKEPATDLLSSGTSPIALFTFCDVIMNIIKLSLKYF